MSLTRHQGEITLGLVILGAAAAIGLLLTNLTGYQSATDETGTEGGSGGGGSVVCCPLAAEFSGNPPNFCWRDDRVPTGQPGHFDGCRYSAACPEGEHLELIGDPCRVPWDLANHASGTSICPKSTAGTSYVCVPNAMPGNQTQPQ